MIILDIVNKRNAFSNLSFRFHSRTEKFYYLDNIVRHVGKCPRQDFANSSPSPVRQFEIQKRKKTFVARVWNYVCIGIDISVIAILICLLKNHKRMLTLHFFSIVIFIARQTLERSIMRTRAEVCFLSNIKSMSIQL